MDYSVIYQNQNVYIVHFDSLSSQYDKEVYGTLVLAEKRKYGQGNMRLERFIVWKPLLVNGEEAPKNVRNIKIDLENIKSIKRAKMTIGNCYSYMIFYEREGNHHPMLVFRDGGTKNLLDKLRMYININTSMNDKNLYIVESKRDQNILDNFENWQFFVNDVSTPMNRKKRTQVSTNVWSGLINLGANISNQLQRSGLQLEDNSRYKNLIKEDALSIEYSNHLKLDTKTDNDNGFTIVSKPVRINLPPASPIQRREPLTEAEWNKHVAPDGSITCVEKLKEKIFKGGIEMSIRKTVWKYLLGYYKWEWTTEDIKNNVAIKKELYDKLLIQWHSIFPDQEERFALYQDRKSIIDRDVHRTDRMLDFYQDENGNLVLVRNILMSYSMYNFNLGYVQGMNDLLAPVLYIMHDEVDAFWCFAKFMDIMEPNFNFDQTGIKKQFAQLYTLLQLFDPEFADYLEHKGCQDMLFCFRFMLVNFKRELSYEHTMYLWEVLWTNYRCWNFHLLFTLSVLLHQRNHILENRYGLHEILKHVNDLVLNNDLEHLLCRAESLYLQLEQIWPQVPQDMKAILDFRGGDSNSVSIATNPTQLLSNTQTCSGSSSSLSMAATNSTTLPHSHQNSSFSIIDPVPPPSHDNFSSDFN